MNLPPEPIITSLDVVKLTNQQGVDTLMKLTIGFTDGDGNFGLDDDDISPPFDFGGEYYFNVNVFYYYQNEDSLMVPYLFNDNHFIQSFRIPRLQSDNKTDAIIAEIDVLLLTSVGGVNHKTLNLDVELVDRKKNRSKIERTEIINLNL